MNFFHSSIYCIEDSWFFTRENWVLLFERACQGYLCFFGEGNWSPECSFGGALCSKSEFFFHFTLQWSFQTASEFWEWLPFWWMEQEILAWEHGGWLKRESLRFVWKGFCRLLPWSRDSHVPSTACLIQKKCLGWIIAKLSTIMFLHYLFLQ